MNALPPAGGSTEYIPNNLVWAILATLFCCLPLGIVSIVYAALVDGKRAASDLAGARESARKARFWAWCSALAGPVFIAAWLFLFGGLALLAGLSGVQ